MVLAEYGLHSDFREGLSMIKAFPVTCLLLVACGSLRADYMSVVLKDEPVGYWRLGEEDIEDPLMDSSGNDLEGEYVTNGNTGLEIGFDGALEDDDDTAVRFQTSFGFGCGDCGKGQVPVSEELDLGTILDGSSLTLEAWFKLLPSVNVALPPSAFPRLFHYNNGGLGQYAFGVVGNGSGGFPGQRTVWAAQGDGSGGGGLIKAALTDAIEPSDDEEWHHFVAVIEDGEIRLFLDTEELEDLDDSDPISWQATQATIGARTQNNGALVQGFPGLIDEIAVYADALSDEAICAHYEAGIDPQPDEPAAPSFRRGDANADGQLNVTDGVFVLSYLFGGGATPPCIKAADTNDTGVIDLTDGVLVLNYLFATGAEPNPPFAECGPDPTADELTCDAFAPCM
ncbi:MAG: hypothetical protein O7J95_09480 [Planctomycetota bacterium]|nr:hypothetical protein [Planctomycetota bacterium]